MPWELASIAVTTRRPAAAPPNGLSSKKPVKRLRCIINTGLLTHTGRVSMLLLERTLQVIRPCRKSEKGWLRKAARLSENHSSLVLNERDPALKVFWARLRRDGRRSGAPECACLLDFGERHRFIQRLTEEKRAERSPDRSNSSGFFRFENLLRHQSIQR